MTQWKNLREFFSRRKKKIEITIETNESWEVHWIKKSSARLCPECTTETVFIPADLVAQIFQTETDEIENLISDGCIHFTELSEKERLVCFSSLKKELGKENITKFLKE